MATTKKNNSNVNNSGKKCCGSGKCHSKPLGRKRLVAPAPVKKPGLWDRILAFFKLD